MVLPLPPYQLTLSGPHNKVNIPRRMPLIRQQLGNFTSYKMDLNIKKNGEKRIVVIGGGFAGIELAKQLSRKKVQVVILDRHNYHTFQPLLYQVATAGLEPDSIAYPLRRLFRKIPNCLFSSINETNSS